MASLKEFAENSKEKSGPIPWREQSEANRAAWIEACKGIKNGISARKAAIWLVEEQDCPLMVDTIRTQLRNTMERYVKS